MSRTVIRGLALAALTAAASASPYLAHADTAATRTQRSGAAPARDPELAALTEQVRAARREERELRQARRAKRDRAAIERREAELDRLRSRVAALRAQQ